MTPASLSPGGSHDNNPPKIIDSRDMAFVLTVDKNGVSDAQAQPGLPRRQVAEWLRFLADEYERQADQLGEPGAPDGGFGASRVTKRDRVAPPVSRDASSTESELS